MDAAAAPASATTVDTPMSEFTIEELFALFMALELDAPLVFRSAPYWDGSEEQRRTVAEIGWRSLVARGLARVDGEHGALAQPVSLLAQALSSASHGVCVVRLDNSEQQPALAMYWIADRLTVGHRFAQACNHHFTLFPTSIALEVITEAAGLDDQPAMGGEEAVLTFGHLRRLIEDDDPGGAASAVAAQLRDAGVAGAVADTIAGMVIGDAATVAVQIGPVATDDAADGMVGVDALVTWIDAGPRGLWLADAPRDGIDAEVLVGEPHDADDEQPDDEPILRLVPVAAAALGEALAAGLPGWVRGDA